MRGLVRSAVQRAGLAGPLGSLKRRSRRAYWWARRRLNQPKVIVREVDGVTTTFAVDEPAGLTYHEFETERAVLSELLSVLSPEDVFYDIGANIGLYACFAAAMLPGPRIVAFEPTPETFRKLERNLELNATGARCERTALGAQDGTTDLLVDRSDTYARETVVEPGTTGVKPTSYVRHRVPVRRAETIVAANGLPQPTVLKVDVEGAELDVLSGFGDHLSTVRVVLVEVHHHKGPEEDDPGVVPFLAERGFESRTLDQRDGAEFVLAERPGTGR